MHVHPQGRGRRRRSEPVWSADRAQYCPTKTALSEFTSRLVKLRGSARAPRTTSEAAAWHCRCPAQKKKRSLLLVADDER